jgi:hypothetical protein
MSIPANQLASYRSYSYYHVLCICDSTATSSDLAGETTLDMWQHAKNNSDLGKYGIKQSANGGNYCVLINGSTDADFTITKTSWTSYTASAATMNDRNTSLSLEGQISISEPRGVIFLNQVVQCCIALGIDSSNASWVLKTFFVGFTFDTTEDTDGADFINDIPPVIFVAYDVTGNFTMVGGEYEITFLAAANSAARLPQYSKSATAANVAPAGSVSDTLKALQIAVQNNYDRYYDCVAAQVAANPSTKDMSDKLRHLTYIITCDPPYLDNDFYKTTDQSLQIKNLSPCGPGAVAIPPGMSIDDAIAKIVDMSKEIKDEAAVGVGGKKYTTKIQNWVHTKKDIAGGIQFEVGYVLTRQEQPTSVSFEQFSSGSSPSGSAAKNLITFDYLYTGKNIDILELDLKMNMGIFYLQGATIQNHYKQPGQDVATTATSVDAERLNRANSQNIPVLFGNQIKSANVRDTKDINGSVQHAYSMSKHASLEALETTIKITGNTQLLGSINQTSDPDFIKSRVIQPTKGDNYARFSEWGTSPSFVKVNIKMPRNNNDESLFTGSQTSQDSAENSSDYAVDFWYQGYYYVYGIDHVFDNGEFYQTISALAIPDKNTFSSTTSTTNAEPIDIGKLADKCYENVIGCGSVTTNSNQNAIIYPEDHESIKTPTAKQDVVDATPSDRNLSNIKGYDQASPEVKRAIHNAAVNNGVDEFSLAQICAVETGGTFNPNSAYHRPGKPPSANGAKGLFQFVGPTWRSYGGGDPFDPELNADRGAKYFATNRDALRKSLGRDPTVSEVYLAHNQGLGGATGVLKAVDSGNGNSQAKLTNPSGNEIHDTSANGAALWAKNIMGSRLKNGAPYDNYDRMQQGSSQLPESKQKKPKTNREALAAVKSCGNNDTSTANKETTPSNNSCDPKVPDTNATDTTTPSVPSAGPRNINNPLNPANPNDWNSLLLNPVDDFSLGTDKYVKRIPNLNNIYDNPVPEITTTPVITTPPRFL